MSKLAKQKGKQIKHKTEKTSFLTECAYASEEEIVMSHFSLNFNPYVFNSLSFLICNSIMIIKIVTR